MFVEAQSAPHASGMRRSFSLWECRPLGGDWDKSVMRWYLTRETISTHCSDRLMRCSVKEKKPGVVMVTCLNVAYPGVRC